MYLIRHDMICLVYVNDYLFLAPDNFNFDSMLQNLRDTKLTLEKEDNVPGFHKVYLNVNHNKVTVELNQRGLIDIIIHAMGLDDSTSIKILAEYDALPKNKNSDTCNSTFKYSSIVGMLLYLQINQDLILPLLYHNVRGMPFALNFLTKRL